MITESDDAAPGQPMHVPLTLRSNSFVGSTGAITAFSLSPTNTLRKNPFSKMGYTMKAGDTPTTTRSKHLYNRAWYIENQKLMKGEEASHPLMNAAQAIIERSLVDSHDIIGDVIRAEPAGGKEAAVNMEMETKRWETSFESFLSSYSLLRSDISTDLQKRGSEADLSSLGDVEQAKFDELNDTHSQPLYSSRDDLTTTVSLDNPKPKAVFRNSHSRADATSASGSIFANVSTILRTHSTSPFNDPTNALCNNRSSGNISSPDARTRRSFTEIHNTAELGFNNASAFLGDNLSVHQNLSSFLHEGSANFFMKTMNKSISLEHMTIGARAVIPCTISMPGFSPAKAAATPKLLNDVPSGAWFTPYIVAGLGNRLVDELLAMRSVFDDEPRPGKQTARENIFTQMTRASWTCLGEVSMSKDPSWRPWERRRLFLCDNFLFECTVDSIETDTPRIIGFAPLCLGSITLISGAVQCDEEEEEVMLDARLNEVVLQSESAGLGGYAISVSVLKQSINDRNRMGFWIYLHKNTLRAFDLIQRAAAKTADNVYRFKDSVGTSLLGSGRFNVVVVGQRALQPISPCEAESSSSSSKDLAEQLVEMDGIDIVEVAQAVSPPQGQPRALKLVSKSVFWARVQAGKERPDALVREFLAQFQVNIEANKTLRTTSADMLPVVRVVGFFETIDGFVIEQELMHDKDLFDLLVAHGVFSEEHCKQVVRQLLDAIDICSRIGIAHRDVKLSNITFPVAFEITKNAKGALTLPSTLHIKLADFGMAGFCERPHSNHCDGTCIIPGRCGTPGYVAPDILNARIGECYSSNVDVFSIGVVAYSLLCGYEPFYGRDDKELVQANRNTEYAFHDPEWTHISEEAKDFIRRSLLPTGEKRLKVAEAKAHPWLCEAK